MYALIRVVNPNRKSIKIFELESKFFKKIRIKKFEKIKFELKLLFDPN